ncbi:MAG TPA: DUF6691 family protein [Bryobacteraceae bacterium]|nr:DUF6691 family protein [Bryobacteraceae bacterium]
MSTAPTHRENATHPPRSHAGGAQLAYVLLGVCFGITLTRSEVLSWFRIQEMFRFQSPRMYEIIASAIVVAGVSIAYIKGRNVKTFSGEPITIPPKTMGRGIRYAVGGTIFGLGWALAGACPGPMFALVGNGVTVMIVAIGSALAGTWLYGVLRARLPH